MGLKNPLGSALDRGLGGADGSGEGDTAAAGITAARRAVEGGGAPTDEAAGAAIESPGVARRGTVSERPGGPSPASLAPSPSDAAQPAPPTARIPESTTSFAQVDICFLLRKARRAPRRLCDHRRKNRKPTLDPGRRHVMQRLFLAIVALGLVGCAPGSVDGRAPASPTKSARGLVRPGTPDDVNIAAARARNLPHAFPWLPLGPEIFERARREHKLVLLDGAAEWCHWCHVMDETTYRDPEIARILRERFLTARVDVDERPDIAERYGSFGWPATILFSPDGEELGKYRGYLPADELRAILEEAERSPKPGPFTEAPRGLESLPGPVEALGLITGFAALQLDGYYDEKQGGWGQRQKSPLGANVVFELRRAARGDQGALARARLTLEKQRALLDPVWGGVYQYSTGGSWASPHYEKLMPYQTANLEAYALGYAATRDEALLADARRIAGYLSTFLSNPDGAFLVSQDADVGAHDPASLFVDGDIYHRLSDPERRKLGVPRVDDHVYAHENGLAISAFCALFDASRDPAILARARRAADLMLRTLVAPDGGVLRGTGKTRYLGDAASLGRAFALLAERTGEGAYRDAALRLAAAMERDFADPATGALWAHTADPAAAGVFARRTQPFASNVLAARFLAALSHTTGDQSLRDRGRKLLAAVTTPKVLEGQGRMIGELLLALDELGVVAWSAGKTR